MKIVDECSRRLDVTDCPADKRPSASMKTFKTLDHEEFRHFQNTASALAQQVFK